MSLPAKQTVKNFLQNKGHLIVLFLFSALSPMMYFFVRFSTDKNLSIIYKKTNLAHNEQLFQIALENNEIIANMFLYTLLALTIFLVFMFFRQYISYHHWEIGLYRSLGISSIKIILWYIIISSGISLVGSLSGYVGGYFLSSVLINAYVKSYQVIPVKGISYVSIIIGFLLPLIFTIIGTWIPCLSVCKKDIVPMLYEMEEKDNHPWIVNLSNKISCLLPKRLQERTRLALRRPVSLLLILVGVITLTIMTVLNISLNQSSAVVKHNQMEGRNYKYQVTYPYILEDDAEGSAFLLESATMSRNDTTIPFPVILYGVQDENEFILYDKKGQEISVQPNSLIVGVHFAEIYGYEVGDSVVIELDGKQYPITILAIAQNAITNAVYMEKDSLADCLNLPTKSYNSIWSNSLPENSSSGTVLTMEEWETELNRDAVSNKISGVINQSVGIFVGCLLLYLALLLTFQSQIQDIITLKLLGYSEKEINVKLLHVYSGFIFLFFILSILPACLVARSIQHNLSIQTKDYMPFQFSIVAVLLIGLILCIVYCIVSKIFEAKIKSVSYDLC